MTVKHTTAVRNGIANFVVDQLDEGPGPGVLVFLTAGDVVAATLTLSKPACGDASIGAAVFNSITSDTNSVGGVVAKCSFRNSSGVEKLSGSVTTTGRGGDITLNEVNISPGQTVSIDNLNYVAAF